LCSGVDRQAKREIDQLEPYLGKRTGFSWLPRTDTNYYSSTQAHETLKYLQDRRDLHNIPDYFLWSIGNFFLFFIFGIICLILSVRVREYKRNENFATAVKLSQRTFVMNIVTTIFGVAFLVTMLALLINKSSTNF